MSGTPWHYQDGSRAVGPVDETTIRQRLHDGRMPAGTLLWCEGMAAWTPVESTLFAADVPLSSATGSGTSTTIHIAPVTPMPAWLIACLPLGLLVLSSVPGAGLIALLGYIGLAMHDRETFRRAGRTPSNAYWWMILLGAAGAPIYLYLRARRLGDPWGYVVASVLALLLFFAVTLLAGADAAV
jgi:hypothetical protein